MTSIQVVEHGEAERDVLPGTAAVLGFQYRGRVRAGSHLLSMAGVTGIQRRPRTYRYDPETASILVRFTAQGAACLGVSASELADRSVALEAILPAALVRDASERVVGATSPRARVDVVEKLLLGLPFDDDPVVDRALALLSLPRPETLPVARVARAVGLSERQLERRVLARVGVTPKRFATLCRFERALTLAKPTTPLSRLAFDAGYCDQSHFIREFRSYAGASPGTLLRRA